MKAGDLCRIKGGPDAGRLVRFWFVNASGNLDCRYADDGEIVVVVPGNLEPMAPDREDEP
jgi:hypothetical protein